MVATWNIAADAAYYAREEGRARDSYYVGGREPAGTWYAPKGDFGLKDGAPVDPELFERLYAGLDANGRALLSNSTRDRIAAYDMTFSAPRSVTLAWAFADATLKARIEVAVLRAVRAALQHLAQEATFARRGHNGQHLEKVALSAALFQHGESRPAEHEDGKVFSDPNLHIHAVIPNMATRADGSVGALFSIAQRDAKMVAGGVFHCELAAALGELGFEIDRIGRNGIFEIAGVDDALIDYFSARRREIEAELAEHGVSSADAAALAAAIAKSTRQAKNEEAFGDRDATWKSSAAEHGIDVASFSERLRQDGRVFDTELAERRLADRLADVPAQLTVQRSVFERKDLLIAVATALVGTGLPSSRITVEAERLVTSGAVLEIGVGRFDQPRYTTPEVLAAEQHLSATAAQLVANGAFDIDRSRLAAKCFGAGLSDEQANAALTAAGNEALAVMTGAPGGGKTTTLSVVVDAYRSAGHRVVGAASAWRVAHSLRDDLSIESRATASWLEGARHGQRFLEKGDVLVVDEAGLVDLTDMNALLRAVEQAEAKVILVGDTKQLQPIGGPALSVVERAVEAAMIEQIVRQHEPWARDAIRNFGRGRASAALGAFADHGQLIEAEGPAATIKAVVETWNSRRQFGDAPLLVARTNAATMAISRSVREVLREEGVISGPEITFPAVTPSGQTTSLSVSKGDQIRFLHRNDRLGVINGSVAQVIGFEREDSNTPGNFRIQVEVGGRRLTFPLAEMADNKGRVRLAWAYASTIYQAQGMTVDNAVVLVDPSFDRHQIYVASSRARQQTTLVVDGRAIDRHLSGEMPVGREAKDERFEAEARCAWLAQRLSRASTKESALEVLSASGRQSGPSSQGSKPRPHKEKAREKSREASLG